MDTYQEESPYCGQRLAKTFHECVQRSSVRHARYSRSWVGRTSSVTGLADSGNGELTEGICIPRCNPDCGYRHQKRYVCNGRFRGQAIYPTCRFQPQGWVIP